MGEIKVFGGRIHGAFNQLSSISASGNRFLVGHLSSPLRLKHPIFKKIQKKSKPLCHQHGRDGLIVFIPLSKPVIKSDWRMLFYNLDGSEAEMCGNGACCGVEYIFKKKLTNRKTIILKTKSGMIKGSFLNKKAQIVLPIRSPIKGPYFISHTKDPGFKKISYFFSSTPVPHAVLKKRFKHPLSKKLKAEILPLAKKLRHCSARSKNGMNVSFYWESSYGKLMGLTFERGVEDITSACGTGAMAIAQVYQKKLSSPCPKVLVQMPGGKLEVNLALKNISLNSPVCWI